MSETEKRYHERRVIREFYMNLFKHRISIVGERVYRNRFTPLWLAELPCVCIYTLTDTPQPRARGQYFYRQNLELTVEALVDPGIDKVDDEIDAILQELEDLVMLNPEIRDPETNVVIASFFDIGQTSMGLKDGGSQILGSGRLSVNVEYDKEFPIGNASRVGSFKLAATDIELGAGDNNTTPEVKANITLEGA